LVTPKERLLAPFRGHKPDQPAWLVDLGYWHRWAEATGNLGSEYAGDDGYLRLHEDLGVCAYYGLGRAAFTSRLDGVDAGTHEEGGERTRFWRTPAGEISDRWRYIEEAHCWAHVEYAVKTAADLAVLQDIFQRTSREPNPGPFEQGAERLGDRGVPICPVPRSPLPALLADWCGVMTTAYMVHDEPQAVADTLAAIDQSNDAAFDAAASSPAELFHFCDNLDSAASAGLFDELMADYYSRRLEQLHRAGKFAVVHLDGTVRGLLPKLAACGFDGVESITPAPVGDVEIEDLRALAGHPRTILWGGIPGAMFCPPWTRSDVVAQTERLLDALWEDGRLVVGSADQVPPNGDIAFCRAVADTIACL